MPIHETGYRLVDVVLVEQLANPRVQRLYDGYLRQINGARVVGKRGRAWGKRVATARGIEPSVLVRTWVIA